MSTDCVFLHLVYTRTFGLALAILSNDYVIAAHAHEFLATGYPLVIFLPDVWLLFCPFIFSFGLSDLFSWLIKRHVAGVPWSRQTSTLLAAFAKALSTVDAERSNLAEVCAAFLSSLCLNTGLLQLFALLFEKGRMVHVHMYICIAHNFKCGAGMQVSAAVQSCAGVGSWDVMRNDFVGVGIGYTGLHENPIIITYLRSCADLWHVHVMRM